MKKLIIAICVLFSLSANAQNAKVDKQGNYIAITKAKDTTAAKESGKTFTDSKGIVYPVFISTKGKLFIKKTSKAGNDYKFYITTSK